MRATAIAVIILVICGLALFIPILTVSPGGPLTPAGSPGLTGISLENIETTIVLSQTDTPGDVNHEFIVDLATFGGESTRIKLTQDIVPMPGKNAIGITGQGTVVIDGNNKTIRGDGSADGVVYIGTPTQFTRVAIWDTRFESLREGISLPGLHNGELKNIRLSSMERGGVDVGDRWQMDNIVVNGVISGKAIQAGDDLRATGLLVSFVVVSSGHPAPLDWPSVNLFGVGGGSSGSAAVETGDRAHLEKCYSGFILGSAWALGADSVVDGRLRIVKSLRTLPEATRSASGSTTATTR